MFRKILILLLSILLPLSSFGDECSDVQILAGFGSQSDNYWIGVYKVENTWALEIAGEFPLHMTSYFMGGTVGYLGELDIALEKIPRGHNFVVILNSNGGPGVMAQAASEHIRSKCESSKGSICQITAYIPPGASCSSACIAVFAKSARYQVMAGGTALGLHAGRSNFGRQSTIDEGIDFYSRAGFDLDWLKKNANDALSSTQMKYYSASELSGSGLNLSSEKLAIFERIQKFHTRFFPDFDAFRRYDTYLEFTAPQGAIPITKTFQATISVHGGGVDGKDTWPIFYFDQIEGAPQIEADTVPSSAYLCLGPGKDGRLHHQRRNCSANSTLYKKLVGYMKNKTKLKISIENGVCLGNVEPLE